MDWVQIYSVVAYTIIIMLAILGKTDDQPASAFIVPILFLTPPFLRVWGVL